MSYTTVIPAYGRDYRSQKDARESWNKNQDWILCDAMSPWDGKPINKSQADAEGMKINLRFDGLTKVCPA